MPQKIVYVEPDVLLEYKGVKVYYTYRHDDIEMPSVASVTVNPGDTDWKQGGGFCLSALPLYDDSEHQKAIDSGAYTEIEYAKTVLRHAIDVGHALLDSCQRHFPRR